MRMPAAARTAPTRRPHFVGHGARQHVDEGAKDVADDEQEQQPGDP